MSKSVAVALADDAAATAATAAACLVENPNFAPIYAAVAQAQAAAAQAIALTSQMPDDVAAPSQG